MAEDFEGETPTTRFAEEIMQNYVEEVEADEEFERDLIDSYKDSVRDHLPQLKLAMENKDAKEGSFHAHTIKGGSGYLGAQAVEFISGKIDALCKAGKVADAAAHVKDLETETEEIFKLLDQYMKRKYGGGDEEASEEKEEKGEKKDEKVEKVTEASE